MDQPHVRLAALRAHLELSRGDFAQKLGLTPEAVSLIERNRRSVGRDVCFRIERLSREPNARGDVWSDGPLLASEWDGHKAHEDAPSADADAAPPLSTDREVA